MRRPAFTRTLIPWCVTVSPPSMTVLLIPLTSQLSDSLSYQALFYFLVIKPAITLLLSLFLVIVIVPAMCTVVLAPLALRVVRRLGVWQAGVGVEGLAVAVR